MNKVMVWDWTWTPVFWYKFHLLMRLLNSIKHICLCWILMQVASTPKCSLCVGDARSFNKMAVSDSLGMSTACNTGGPRFTNWLQTVLCLTYGISSLHQNWFSGTCWREERMNTGCTAVAWCYKTALLTFAATLDYVTFANFIMAPEVYIFAGIFLPSCVSVWANDCFHYCCCTNM